MPPRSARRGNRVDFPNLAPPCSSASLGGPGSRGKPRDARPAHQPRGVWSPSGRSLVSCSRSAISRAVRPAAGRSDAPNRGVATVNGLRPIGYYEYVLFLVLTTRHGYRSPPTPGPEPGVFVGASLSPQRPRSRRSATPARPGTASRAGPARADPTRRSLPKVRARAVPRSDAHAFVRLTLAKRIGFVRISVACGSSIKEPNQKERTVNRFRPSSSLALHNPASRTRSQPSPIGLALIHYPPAKPTITVLNRQWSPGAARHCSLCPPGTCCVTPHGHCTLVVPEVVPDARAALWRCED